MRSEEDFFHGYEDSWGLYTRLMDEGDRLGPAQVVVSESQIALRRAKNFAVVRGWLRAAWDAAG